MSDNHAEFYRGVEAARAAAAGTAGSAAAVATAVHRGVANLLAATPSAPARACRPGCAHCCHYPVGISFGEAVLLAGAVRTEPELRARVLAAAAAPRAWAQLVGRPCPLLVGGRCAAYALRPLPCRALASGDDAACAAALAGTSGPAVPRDDAAFWRGLGASSALADLTGHGVRELRAAVAALLVHGDDAAAFAAASTAG